MNAKLGQLLLDSGIITSKQLDEALVQADGTILFEGAAYESPSAAGGAVTAKHDLSAPNGWWFWQVTDSAGATKRLETVRQEYISQQSPEQKG